MHQTQYKIIQINTIIHQIQYKLIYTIHAHAIQANTILHANKIPCTKHALKLTIQCTR